MIIKDISKYTDTDTVGFSLKKLQLFRNPEFTVEHLTRLHSVPSGHKKNVERQALEIRYCLIQADEYFKSAANATLATRPVLIYYGLMNFALAEILVKKTSDSRLEKLREAHPAHGLSLKVLGVIDVKTPLTEIVQRLKAAPQFRNTGLPYGTFEVWRTEVREVPVPVLYTDVHGGILSTGTRTLLTGADRPPSKTPASGHSLLDAVRGIPQLQTLLQKLGIAASTVRGTLTQEMDPKTGSGKMTLIVHPTEATALERLLESVILSPSAINQLQIQELPSGIILTLPVVNNNFDTYLSFPPTIALDSSFIHFLTYEWDIGEFGSYYVALHILGNLARYYPDIWMHHLERSTTFILLVEQLCDLAVQRVPLLCIGEMERCYYIKDL